MDCKIMIAASESYIVRWDFASDVESRSRWENAWVPFQELWVPSRKLVGHGRIHLTHWAGNPARNSPLVYSDRRGVGGGPDLGDPDLRCDQLPF